MPGPRMLRRLLPEITVFITETLRYKQTLLAYEGMRDTRMPLPPKAQKHRNCDGEPEG